MRKAEFFVPSEVVVEFAEAMVNHNLRNTVSGTSEDGEDVIIEVEYGKEETKAIDELEKTLETLCEQLEAEQEEEEQEDEEDERRSRRR